MGEQDQVAMGLLLRKLDIDIGTKDRGAISKLLLQAEPVHSAGEGAIYRK